MSYVLTLILGDKRRPEGFIDVLRFLVGQKAVLLFMILLVAMGMMKGVIDAFLFVYLQDMGGNGTLLGVTLATTTISELPFFAFSGTILRRLGALCVIFISMGAYAGRLLYYSQLSRPWSVLPIELLHGVTFSLSWATIVAHAQEVAPEGYAVYQPVFRGFLAREVVYVNA
eukprot:m.70150 g.70150  ORF g.70150 m.70150 type:complete len:171 (-) comp11659_c0_seq10:561-1073(-)